MGWKGTGATDLKRVNGFIYSQAFSPQKITHFKECSAVCIVPEPRTFQSETLMVKRTGVALTAEMQQL